METARAFARVVVLVLAGLAIVAGASSIRACGAIAGAIGALSRGHRARLDASLRASRAIASFQRAVLAATCRALRIHVHLDAASLRAISATARKPTLFLCNHVSYLDVVALGAILPTCFLGKSEVASWPVIGWAGRAAGMLLVDRASLGGRVAALLRLRDRLRTANALVFPEGSTTARFEPARELWKDGQIWSAREAAGGVVCLGLCYVDHAAAAWIDDMELAPHLWGWLRRPESHVFVRARALDPELPRHAPARARSRAAFETVRTLCVAAHRAALDFQQSELRGTDAAPFLSEEATCNRNS